MIFENIESPALKAMCSLLDSLDENLYNPFALVDRNNQRIVYASTSMIQVYKDCLNYRSNSLLQLKEKIERFFLPLYQEKRGLVNSLLEQFQEKDWKVVRFCLETVAKSLNNRQIVYMLNTTPVLVPDFEGHELVLFTLSLASNNPQRRLAVCIENSHGERHYYLRNINETEWKPYDKSRLTPMESHIMLMSGYGLTSKEMSQILCCSESTIKSHRSHINEKLGANSNAEALVSAMNQKVFFASK